MIDNTVFENKLAAYYTLGCKLNFAETSSIGKLLSEVGVRRVRKGQKADICVINTCSVTELADKKCRQTIRKMITEHPEAFVVVTGCYAQLKPGDVADIPGVDIVLGSEQKLDILQYIDALRKKDKGAVFTTKTSKINSFSHSCSQDDRTRYFLKVQDGCDYYCSFCTIPYARGRSRNGYISDIVKQAEDVAAKGGKEIVLTGVNIGDFGKSTGETFFDLVKQLDEVEGIERFRISSIEPNLLTDEIINFVSTSKRFAPHFHLPLQSGSDDVLKLMRRKYDTELFAYKMKKIKQTIPDAFIGVDVIVGVRGETDELFKNSHDFISSLPITQLHVFTYSERPGTKALQIEYAVDVREKQRRSRDLMDISDAHLLEFYNSNIGTKRRVLFEQTKKDGKMFGFTENYVKIVADYEESLVNKVVNVEVGEYDEQFSAMRSVII